MPETYPAAEVDAIIQDTWKLAESAIKIAEEKDALCARLMGEKVELEKIATTAKLASAKTPALDAKQLDDVLDQLQDLAILDPKGREKIAAAIIADPNKAFDLIIKVATTSQSAPEQGRGLGKSASRRAATDGSQDPDGWGNITPEAP